MHGKGISLLTREGRQGGGVDGEKDWSSINHSILSWLGGGGGWIRGHFSKGQKKIRGNN